MRHDPNGSAAIDSSRDRLATSDIPTAHPERRPALRLVGVGFSVPAGDRAGRREILRDVSLDVARGEIVALLGRSGAGKSTLLNIVAGLARPDRGTVELSTPGRGPAFAYMFQEDRLLPWRSASRNVQLAFERLGRSDREAAALEALGHVGLGEAASLHPWQLSGGMRARVALARSLALSAPLLLMDEPFGKLDPATRSEMHALTCKLRDELGFGALLVTHDAQEAAILADRALVLAPDPGRIAGELTIGPDKDAAASRLLQLIGPADPVTIQPS